MQDRFILTKKQAKKIILSCEIKFINKFLARPFWGVLRQKISGLMLTWSPPNRASS